MSLDWRPDVLGEGYDAADLALRPGDDGPVNATLVRHRPVSAPSAQAVLYVHGFNDYFFQRELGGWWAAQGIDFYAVDLRRHGRSIRPGQTPNYVGDLTDYFEELDAAADAIADLGHDRLVVMGHSTGGLVASLWLDRRRSLPVDGLVLNSPFFEFKQPAVVRALVGRTAAAVGRRQPQRILPGGVDSNYGDAIHVGRHGEWDFDLAWKPSPGFPVRFGWLAAIIEGHRTLHAGLDLRVPALVMCSTRTVTVKGWDELLRRGDAVLDADSIARWAPAVGRNVTVLRIEDGMHDLVLSLPPVRESVYQAMGTWLGAWAS